MSENIVRLTDSTVLLTTKAVMVQSVQRHMNRFTYKAHLIIRRNLIAPHSAKKFPFYNLETYKWKPSVKNVASLRRFTTLKRRLVAQLPLPRNLLIHVLNESVLFPWCDVL